jgi:hypothetical protein
MSHIIKTNDVVRWAKQPIPLYRVLFVHPDGWVHLQVIGEGWVKYQFVQASELTLAPVDLEDIS